LLIATGVALLSVGILTAPAIAFSLLLSAYYVVSKQPHQGWLLMLGLALLAVAISAIPPTAFFMAALVPTVVHVFVFTGSFLLVGCLKNNDKGAAITLALFVTLGLSFFFIPHAWLDGRYHVAQFPVPYFNGLAIYLSGLTHQAASVDAASNIFAFLSFAYTYHYLNWFSKTGIIRWHDISRQRAATIIALYIVAIGSYLYHYDVGFKVLLFLSLLHVLLEFPLNIRTFATIGAALRRKPS
jgi:hypothetical protein